MRRMGVLLGGFVMVLIAGGIVTGQAPFGGGGFGGGIGGGGAGADPIALLRNPQIKKELDLTDEQLEKLPAALAKVLKEVLDEKQQKRFRQIELQLKGSRAFNDADVQSELKITAEQKESITNIFEESRKELAEIFKEAKGGNFQGMREKMTGIQKETNEKVQGVLTADQKKSWRKMTGDEFKLETGGFGKKGGKKKDTQ